MKFSVPKIDIRSFQSGGRPINDGNGETVGLLDYQTNSGRHVNLFGKYEGTYKTHEEAQAFADGVASVLRHMTDRNNLGR